ncbi:MAG: RNA-protein complex protein Nop10 [Thermoplasmata archaeon]|nr:RNA-protein complex protein Nop10 [Thermoplasmata archaeon]
MSETLLHVCRSCDRYTLAETCPKCHGATRSPHPARFSPQDRYGAYRRRLYASDRTAGAGTI